MQAPGSFTLIGSLVGIVALAMALGVIIGAPILAVPFFVVGFGVFLFWRGKRRTEGARSGTYESDLKRVPTTEDAAADPVRDSGTAEATSSGTAGSQRADAPRV
jgi:hypothetical protein